VFALSQAVIRSHNKDGVLPQHFQIPAQNDIHIKIVVFLHFAELPVESFLDIWFSVGKAVTHHIQTGKIHGRHPGPFFLEKIKSRFMKDLIRQKRTFCAPDDLLL